MHPRASLNSCPTDNEPTHSRAAYPRLSRLSPQLAALYIGYEIHDCVHGSETCFACILFTTSPRGRPRPPFFLPSPRSVESLPLALRGPLFAIHLCTRLPLPIAGSETPGTKTTPSPNMALPHADPGVLNFRPMISLRKQKICPLNNLRILWYSSIAQGQKSEKQVRPCRNLLRTVYSAAMSTVANSLYLYCS